MVSRNALLVQVWGVRSLLRAHTGCPVLVCAMALLAAICRPNGLVEGNYLHRIW